MPRYKITVVETAIYDVYVDGDDLEDAISEVSSVDPKMWFKDVDASSCEIGTDHYVWDGNEWKEAK